MTHKTPRQQGMALIEALVASAVLGLGLVGATQLTLKALHAAALSRQHAGAQLLAQQAMDCLMRHATDCASEHRQTIDDMLFTVQTRVTPRNEGLEDLQVTVQWASSSVPAEAPANSPNTHRIEWHSSVSTLPNWLGVSSP